MTHYTEKRTIEAKQTESQRLASRCDSLAQIADAYDPEAYRQAAAFLRRKDELLDQAMEALELGETRLRFEAITAIRAHREAK